MACFTVRYGSYRQMLRCSLSLRWVSHHQGALSVLWQVVGLLLGALLLLQSKINDISHRNQLIDQRLLEQEEWKHRQLGEVHGRMLTC